MSVETRPNGADLKSSPVRRSLRLRKLAPESVPNQETKKEKVEETKTEAHFKEPNLDKTASTQNANTEQSDENLNKIANEGSEISNEPLNLSMERKPQEEEDKTNAINENDLKKVVKTLFSPKGKLKVNGQKDTTTTKASPELLEKVDTVKTKLCGLNLVNGHDEHNEKKEELKDENAIKINGNIEEESPADESKEENEEIEHKCTESKTIHLAEEVDAKMNDLLNNVSYDTESETEQNPFITSMAEEGEEDTPSEGSNDIIEVGEEINTTESELSTDDSYEDNSFIDDEENHQLLSGEEFDLSFDDGTKKRRIIQLNSGSDEEIVRIERRKKSVKKKKKSRIIRIEDSSDEENKNDEDGESKVRYNTEFKIVDRSVDTSSENCGEKEKADESTVSIVSEKEEERSKKEEENVDGNKELDSSTSNTAACQKENQKIIILENICVQESKELSDCVNNILSSLCPEVKNMEKQEKTDKDPTANKDVKTRTNTKKEKRNKQENKNVVSTEVAFYTENKNFFKSNDVQASHKKRRKRKRKALDSGENTINIKRSKNNKEEITLKNGWEEENVILKPSLKDVKFKSHSLGVSKFHVKDFKGLMLNDRKRVKRMENGCYVKKI